MQRRTPKMQVILGDTPRRLVDDDDGEDDNCPLCIAEREGKPISFEALHDPAYLVAEARRVLRRVKLGPGEEASLVESGHLLPDETYEIVRYTVDAAGCIYLTRNESRSLVLRVLLD
jgi:hypothetical protein